MKALINWNI